MLNDGLHDYLHFLFLIIVVVTVKHALLLMLILLSIDIGVLYLMNFCQVARAAVIFKVDEVVVYEETTASPR